MKGGNNMVNIGVSAEMNRGVRVVHAWCTRVYTPDTPFNLY